jgi:hypothetical protein
MLIRNPKKHPIHQHDRPHYPLGQRLAPHDRTYTVHRHVIASPYITRLSKRTKSDIPPHRACTTARSRIARRTRGPHTHSQSTSRTAVSNFISGLQIRCARGTTGTSVAWPRYDVRRVGSVGKKSFVSRGEGDIRKVQISQPRSYPKPRKEGRGTDLHSS